EIAREHLGQVHLLHEGDRLAERPAHDALVAARHREADHRTLPGVLTADLRHRDVEAVAQASRDLAYDAPLLLERLRFVDPQLDDGHADDHLPPPEPAARLGPRAPRASPAAPRARRSRSRRRP